MDIKSILKLFCAKLQNTKYLKNILNAFQNTYSTKYFIQVQNTCKVFRVVFKILVFKILYNTGDNDVVTPLCPFPY